MTSNFARGALLALTFLIGACGGASSQGGDNAAAAGEDPAAGATGASADMTLGAADAPVTVIEFASVTCPACAKFHETIFPAIKEKYIDTGKVRLIFREFPTPPQGLSYVGSVLARCAADKGGVDAYFLVVSSLFKTQKTWIYGEDPRLELVKLAAQAGMDEAAFDACMNRQDLVDLINDNIKKASDTYNIASTPSFVFNGKVQIVRSIEEFDSHFNDALAPAGQ